MARRIDVVGRRISLHLDRAAKRFKRRGSWRRYDATPRKYWERRFRWVPTGQEVFYNEVESAFEAIDRDKVIDRTMKGKFMSVMVRVVDPSRRGSLWFTAGVGPWDRALSDTLDNLHEWTQRYGRTSEPGDDLEDDDELASSVREIVILVGDDA